MNAAYLSLLAGGAVLCAALFALRLKKAGMPPWSAACALLLCAVLGTVGAKAMYVLMNASRAWPQHGWAVFLRTSEWEFSFFGGCAGALLGAVLTARIARQKAAAFLDAFAPAGALMAAIARGAQFFLGMLGVGGPLEDGSFFCRFPFAVQNEWDEWYWAVFMLEAVLALAVAVPAFLCKKTRKTPGLLAARTVFYLCMGQILCEQLRSNALYWGIFLPDRLSFIRIEQLFCAVCATVLVIVGCAKAKSLPFRRRFLPVLGMLLAIAAVVFAEFAMDRGILYVTNKLVGLPREMESGGVPHNTLICYLFMLLALGIMARMECITARRLKQKR